MKKILMVIAAAASLTLAACGGTTVHQGQSTGNDGVALIRSDADADAIVSDCSSSFLRFADRFVPDMTTVALQSSAKNKRVLYTGCFDGSPKRSLTLKPTDFGNVPAGLLGNEQVEKFNAARALGMRRYFRSMSHERSRFPGSGQLETLEVLSKVPNLTNAWMFSDLYIHQADGIDLATATEADVQRVINRWIPRMGSGLRHVRVVVVGVGLGGPSAVQARRAEQVMRGVVEGAGGSFIAGPTLPPPS